MREPVENLVLRKWPIPLLLDLLADVTSVCVVHDDAQLPFLGLERLDKLDDVGMLQMLDDLGLLQGLLFLIFTHTSNINNLHDAK